MDDYLFRMAMVEFRTLVYELKERFHSLSRDFFDERGYFRIPLTKEEADRMVRALDLAREIAEVIDKPPYNDSLSLWGAIVEPLAQNRAALRGLFRPGECQGNLEAETLRRVRNAIRELWLGVPTEDRQRLALYGPKEV